MESLINLQHVLAALHCASCEKTRFYLQGVCVEIRERESFAVATDGCVLFASHFALEPDAPVNTLLGSFILHKDSLKAMKLRRTSSYVSTMTQLDTATVRIICNDQDLYAKLIDGVFPDWRRIVPNDVSLGEAAKNIDCIEYNTHKLDAFWKVAATLGLRGQSGSGNPFSIARGGDGPATLRFSNDDVLGLIVPFRSDARRGKRPTWV